MKLTSNHALFYAKHKLKIATKVSIHTLINDQVSKDCFARAAKTEKHNDLNLLKMVVARCKRNGEDLASELFKIQVASLRTNRGRLFGKVRLKLIANRIKSEGDAQ